jgi:hypothetical protein
MTAPARAGRAVLHAPGIFSPPKITVKGARCARVAAAMALRATPECDLHRQDRGTYPEDGVTPMPAIEWFLFVIGQLHNIFVLKPINL